MAYVPPGPVFKPGQAVPPEHTNLANEISDDDPQSGLIKRWSYSTLKTYEKCPYSVFLDKVQKLPRVQHSAANRGEELHLLGEQYITGELTEFPIAYNREKHALEQLRKGYIEGRVYVEDEWAFDTQFNRVGWNDDDAWGRMKLDALEMVSDTCAEITDWKSGQKFGNELSHGQQLQLYVIAAFTFYPDLEYVKAQCRYIDKIEPPLTQEYTRKEAMSFRPRWVIRATRLTTAVDFPPKPSRGNCKYCGQRENCEWRIT